MSVFIFSKLRPTSIFLHHPPPLRSKMKYSHRAFFPAYYDLIWFHFIRLPASAFCFSTLKLMYKMEIKEQWILFMEICVLQMRINIANTWRISAGMAGYGEGFNAKQWQIFVWLSILPHAQHLKSKRIFSSEVVVFVY